ncbi:hypothetical protein [Prevotella sp. 10(H)]|uniref:hypothetical protein n=1 Tax=Prevotella sp. 10(H) TaxID=1158294 RepID=UPI0004A6AAC4|nr:hypothetical protein [Prevotella sp. 10(H)]
MKLGNSNGNNTGKKYFIRGRDDQKEPKPENRRKADKFNEWFACNQQKLANFLIGKYSYDEDVFYNTFMRISEKILYTGMSISDYKAYFHRSYFTNYIQDSEKESRYIAMPAYSNLEAHHSNPYEKERMQAQLESDIFDYVYHRYELREFELFKMYISLKPAINYHTLADITKIQAHNIQRIVSKILTDIRGNKVLVNRYRDI